MNCGLFGEALLHLQIVISHEKRDWNKVLPIINLAKCHLLTTNEDKAIAVSVELASLLEQSDVINKLQSVSEICDNKIEELIIKFTNIRSTKTAIMLSSCRIKLIRMHFKDNKKLQKLGLVGYAMHLIAKQIESKQLIFGKKKMWRFSDSNLKQEQTELYSLMDEISLMMNATIFNVEQRQKNQEIIWFLQSYGMCCDLMGDYNKSVKLYAQAKLLMEGVFKDDTDLYKTFGHCYKTIVELHEKAKLNNASTFDEFSLICLIVMTVLVFAVGVVVSHSAKHIPKQYGR